MLRALLRVLITFLVTTYYVGLYIIRLSAHVIHTFNACESNKLLIVSESKVVGMLLGKIRVQVAPLVIVQYPPSIQELLSLSGNL
jgi:hypothetical protein